MFFLTLFSLSKPVKKFYLCFKQETSSIYKYTHNKQFLKI